MEFVDFLIKAKKNTYASSGEGGELKLDDGSRELIYEEEGWRYRDRYFGFNPFLGEEAVWKDGKIFWGMNYYGEITDTEVDQEQLYGFLKRALGLVSANSPYRGLDGFEEGDWAYKEKDTGSAGSFFGEEKIYLSGREVYKLVFNGGLIKQPWN